MEKCPYCDRRVVSATEGTEFMMPDHLNYMKTNQCPASGKNFVNAGNGRIYANTSDAYMQAHRARLDPAIACLVAAWAGRR